VEFAFAKRQRIHSGADRRYANGALRIIGQLAELLGKGQLLGKALPSAPATHPLHRSLRSASRALATAGKARFRQRDLI
jgi:hypothetical protein